MHDPIAEVRAALQKAIENGQVTQYKLQKQGVAAQSTISKFLEGVDPKAQTLLRIARAIGYEVTIKKAKRK